MANEYEISRSTGRCAVTHRELKEGESYYVVLIETAEGFERRDYSVDAWDGPPEGAACFFRARVPVKEKGPIVIDHGVLTHLFQRLEHEESEMKQKFRFVLALLLMRKRMLKFEQTTQDGESEYWQMRLMMDQSVHRVLNPKLTDEEIERLSAQLTALLSGEVDPSDAVEVPEPAEEASSEDQVSESESNPTPENDNEVASS